MRCASATLARLTATVRAGLYAVYIILDSRRGTSYLVSPYPLLILINLFTLDAQHTRYMLFGR